MNPLVAPLLALMAGIEWTVHAPLEVPLAIEKRQEKDEATARVYAARGEFEGFRLSLQADKKGAEGVLVLPGEAGRDLPAPTIFRLLPITGAEITGEYLDHLVPATPVDLAPGEVAHYWVRYAVPVGARAGVEQASLRIEANRTRAQQVPVRIEVFDFELPARPSLPNVFYLDRPLMRSALGLPDADLAAWSPVYAALGGYRLGFSLWDGTALVRGQDTTALREHLEFAAKHLAPAALDFAGNNGAGWRAAPLPQEGQRLDPLNLLLNGVATAPALAQVPLVASFDQFPERAAWPQRLAALRRLDAGSQLLRVAMAPLHPDFELHLDAWAVPLRAYTPALNAAFRAGAGLRGAVGVPAGRARASSRGELSTGTPYTTDPADAVDGSPFTAWLPTTGGPPGEQAWWQIDFEAPVQAESVVIRWLPGHAVTDVQLHSTLDGTNYATTSVKWEHRPAGNPLELPTSTAQLRFPGALLGLRVLVTVGGGSDATVPGIAELSLPSALEDAADATEHPMKAWLALELDTFPTTYPGRHRAEPRLIGWTCWLGGFEGMLGASLNRWPKGLSEPGAGSATAPVDLPQDGGDHLFYPGDGTVYPSLRLERLRDGLEDYEYLRLLDEAVQAGRVHEADRAELLQPPVLPRDANPEQLDAWAVFVQEAHVRMGRLLGAR